MDKFEKQFEDLDVQVSVMDGAMHSSAVASMPEGQVCFSFGSASHTLLARIFLTLPRSYDNNFSL